MVSDVHKVFCAKIFLCLKASDFQNLISQISSIEVNKQKFTYGY